MKKQLLLTLAYLFFFSIIGLSQGLEWTFNLESNDTIIDQSVSHFDLSTFSNSASDNSSDNFSDRILEASSNEITSLAEDYSLFDKSLNERSSNNINPVLIDPNTSNYSDDEWNQNLVFIKMPLNFGYTLPSQKLMIYGGLWYARSIQTGSSIPLIYQNTRSSNENEYGATAGLKLHLTKRVNAIMDVTNNLKSDSSFSTFNSPLVEQINVVPISRNSKLISLGLNFRLK